MSKSGSKIREQVAHFLVDIHTEKLILRFRRVDSILKETDTLDRTVTTFSSVLFSSPDYILFLSVQKNNEAFTKAAK